MGVLTSDVMSMLFIDKLKVAFLNYASISKNCVMVLMMSQANSAVKTGMTGCTVYSCISLLSFAH